MHDDLSVEERKLPQRARWIHFALGRNEILLACASVVLLIVGGLALPGFMSLFNMSRLLQQLMITGLISLGMTFVIVGGNGGIDLSVGSAFGVAAVLVMALQNKVLATTGPGTYTGLDLPIPVAILAALLSGAVFGGLNGVGVTRLMVPPFIMTLVTMSIGRGLIMMYTQGFQFRGVRGEFEFLGGGMLWDFLPIPLIFFAAIAFLSYLVLHRSRFGRKLFAVGANRRAARLSGVRVERVLISSYVVCGVIAALSGILFTSYTTTVDSWGGDGLELQAISAVLVGGTPLLGGRGTLVGTVLGVLFIGFLGNFLVMMNTDPYVLQLVTAGIILAVVLLQSRRQ